MSLSVAPCGVCVCVKVVPPYGENLSKMNFAQILLTLVSAFVVVISLLSSVCGLMCVCLLGRGVVSMANSGKSTNKSQL